MTPERIRDIVCQQPLYWEEAIKNNADELQQHTFDFLNYLIRTQDSEAKQREIRVRGRDPAGLFYLAIPFIEFYRGDRYEEDEGYRDVLHAEEEDLEESLRYSERQQAEDSHDYALDDPRNLLMLIRELAPEVEKSIKSLLRQRTLHLGRHHQQVCRRAGDAGQREEQGRGRRVRRRRRHVQLSGLRSPFMQLVIRDANQGPFLTQVLRFGRDNERLSEQQLAAIKGKAVLMSLKFADKYYNKYKMHLLEQAAHDVIGVVSLRVCRSYPNGIRPRRWPCCRHRKAPSKPFQKGWSMLITVSPKQAGNSLYGDVDARLLDKISSPPDIEEWQGWQEYEKALTEHNKSRLMELIDQHFFACESDHPTMEDKLAEALLYRILCGRAVAQPSQGEAGSQAQAGEGD